MQAVRKDESMQSMVCYLLFCLLLSSCGLSRVEYHSHSILFILLVSLSPSHPPNSIDLRCLASETRDSASKPRQQKEKVEWLSRILALSGQCVYLAIYFRAGLTCEGPE
jgi:hypothetical protein